MNKQKANKQTLQKKNQRDDKMMMGHETTSSQIAFVPKKGKKCNFVGLKNWS